MKQVNVSELLGAALDYAVAVCEGFKRHYTDMSSKKWLGEYSPSSNWSQGGPIIEREDISTNQDSGVWVADTYPIGGGEHVYCEGSTPLIAAMRCYVASKMGEVVEIPEELL